MAVSVSISVENTLPVLGHFTARNCMVRLTGADNCGYAADPPVWYSKLAGTFWFRCFSYLSPEGGVAIS